MVIILIEKETGLRLCSPQKRICGEAGLNNVESRKLNDDITTHNE